MCFTFPKISASKPIGFARGNGRLKVGEIFDLAQGKSASRQVGKSASPMSFARSGCGLYLRRGWITSAKFFSLIAQTGSASLRGPPSTLTQPQASLRVSLQAPRHLHHPGNRVRAIMVLKQSRVRAIKPFYAARRGAAPP